LCFAQLKCFLKYIHGKLVNYVLVSHTSFSL
jgi:hypothetical protein